MSDRITWDKPLVARSIIGMITNNFDGNVAFGSDGRIAVMKHRNTKPRILISF